MQRCTLLLISIVTACASILQLWLCVAVVQKYSMCYKTFGTSGDKFVNQAACNGTLVEDFSECECALTTTGHAYVRYFDEPSSIISFIGGCFLLAHEIIRSICFCIGGKETQYIDAFSIVGVVALLGGCIKSEDISSIHNGVSLGILWDCMFIVAIFRLQYYTNVSEAENSMLIACFAVTWSNLGKNIILNMACFCKPYCQHVYETQEERRREWASLCEQTCQYEKSVKSTATAA